MIPSQLLPALFLLATCACAFPLSDQQPLGNSGLLHAPQLELQDDVDPTSRGLSGRFLHITDLHPDSYYESGASPDRACHRGDGSAGYYGAEGTECDSPITLINETFRWIEKNLKGKVDFVIWTGDSARHDNDEKNPREPEEVLDLNKLVAKKLVETFKDERSVKGISIPIIPTFGNNDIMPHNIFKAGPNRWTKQYREIWSNFIPEHQLHSFVEGGWFISEVIPEKLAVVSLNTMYFFDSNSAVDGCAARSEPGYEHMEWLRVQLEMLRGRHMKAILMGHIPPARAGSKRNWDDSCWQKYTLWLHQFRDVVVGSVYGHMNLDHFMLQDSHKVDIVDVDKSFAYLGGAGDPDELSTQSRSDYLSNLRKDWSKLPSVPAGTSKSFSMDAWFDDDDASVRGSKKKQKKRFLKKIGGPFAERYSVSLVSPSVVPNYFPTLRVVEYNITGLEHAATWANTPSHSSLDSVSPGKQDDSPLSETQAQQSKKPHFKVPGPPSKSAPPGPAYSNQALSWLGYTQYFANLTRINSQLASRGATGDEAEEVTGSKPDDVFAYEVEYNTRDDRVYKMDDLTVRSFFKLASRIAKREARKGQSSSLEYVDEADLDDLDAKNDYDEQDIEAEKKKKKKNRVWKTFVTRAFVGLLKSDDIDDIN